MSKNVDADIYGDIYGDEVDLQDGQQDTEIDGVQEEDFLEPISEPVSPVQDGQNKSLPPATTDNTHALPPKPSASQNSLSYSAQIAQQFSAYQQTPSQERQQRSSIPSSTNGAAHGASGAGKQDDATDTIYGKKPSEMHDHGKLFIGGLSWDTTDEGLRNYFQQFGKVDACTIMRDPSGTSRGFAFLTFEDENSVKAVLGREHNLDGKNIDPKRAIPREEHLRNTRFFVGGLSPSTTAESMKEFFSTYGKVVDATVMMDRDTGRSKGFGFVTYEDATNADQLVGKIGLILDDKQIEVKAAQPRSQRDQARNSSTPTAGRDGGHSDQMTKLVQNNMMQQQPQPQQNQLPMMFNRPMNQVPMMGTNMNMMNMNPMAMMGMGMGMGGFNPMAMSNMNMMNGMQGMAGMNGMNGMGGMAGMPNMANMAGMRLGMGPMGMGMNAGMGAGNMGGTPNMGGINPMGMGMRPNITSMGGGMGRMGAAATGPGPARMSSRGQHNFHPYSR